VNKTEGPRIVPTKQSKDLKLHRELSTKPIQKNSLPLTFHESQFSDKQKFHIAPKQKTPHSIPESCATDRLQCDYN